MAAPRVERRLAALLAADVVGYSYLMERVEAGTLARLKAHRKELIEPLVAEHRGRVVKLLGDGALCEFASVVDAAMCAVEIQRGMAEREQARSEAERIRFRIGVNLGDVIREEDGDLYGDGVNIAARLQQVAEPGGIVVSGTAYNHLQGKLDCGLSSLGELRLKNIERAVRAYRVELGAAIAVPMAPIAAAPLPEKSAVAVLPFDNLSGAVRLPRVRPGGGSLGAQIWIGCKPRSRGTARLGPASATGDHSIAGHQIACARVSQSALSCFRILAVGGV
jgi:adenylate cyclase